MAAAPSCDRHCFRLALGAPGNRAFYVIEVRGGPRAAPNGSGRSAVPGGNLSASGGRGFNREPSGSSRRRRARFPTARVNARTVECVPRARRAPRPPRRAVRPRVRPPAATHRRQTHAHATPVRRSASAFRDRRGANRFVPSCLRPRALRKNRRFVPSGPRAIEGKGT